MEEKLSAKLRRHFNAWELRALVLLSLFLQIVLISTGNRRKYTRNRWVAGILWLSYLSADYIATTALGVLSRAEDAGNSPISPKYTIMALWAPFLLMHLGGPDTITAYALADNELWLRHALLLVSQVLIAGYILFRSWTHASINFLWMVIFVTGSIKYGERTWALYSASRDQFRESMVTPPDPGPNYAKFMDELVSREREGYRVSLKTAIDTVSSSSTLIRPAANVAKVSIQDLTILHEAYYFYGTFKRLFADLILSFQDRGNSFSFFNSDIMDWKNAFRIVEVELGLVYDLLYTKAPIVYSPLGFFLRVLSFSSSIASLIAFVIIHRIVYPKLEVVVKRDNSSETIPLKTEVIITYILLVGAIFLEIYAVLILLSSDKMLIWLTGDWTNVPKLVRKLRDLIVFTIYKIVSLFRYFHIVPATTRWSNTMGQDNVLKCCLEGKPKCSKIRDYLETKFLFGKNATVPKGLKALIFKELKDRANSDEKDKGLGSYRGDKIVLREMKYFGEDDRDQDVEFDRSLLLWHMVTDFCYHTDVDQQPKPTEAWLLEFVENEESSTEDKLKFRREICKLLSNYMMYLSIKAPFMLPSGIGKIRFQDTCAEATDQFYDEQNLSIKNACENLLRVDTRLVPSEVKGDRSKSLLFDACKLANDKSDLQLLEVGKKWEKITEAWLGLLTFAAAQCTWSGHAEKLSQGGELLTHVWLLMAHFGMTDQFQISQGYVRAKLISK